jgi:hypothetical protein
MIVKLKETILRQGASVSPPFVGEEKGTAPGSTKGDRRKLTPKENPTLATPGWGARDSVFAFR